MSLPDQYPEVLVDMADCIRQRLCLSLPADQAEPLALDIMKDIHARFHGEFVYFSKCQAMKLAKRNQAILAEFDGHNHRDLARQYKLTVATIYDIIARAKKSTSPRSA